MLSEVAYDFIVSYRELNRLSNIVCLACDQVIELPVKHPELFEALGIDQPKVRWLVKSLNDSVHLLLCCCHLQAAEPNTYSVMTVPVCSF